MGRATRALLLLTVLAGGCSSQDPLAPPTPPPTQGDGGGDGGDFTPDWCKPSLAAGSSAELVIGEGMTFYRDIEDGTTLTWEPGPQGGHHVWIALKQRGLRQRGTVSTIELEDVETPASPRLINRTKLVFGFDRAEGYDPAKGGWCTLTGLRMQLDNAGISLSELINHRIRVRATLVDPDGATTTGERTIIVNGTF